MLSSISGEQSTSCERMEFIFFLFCQILQTLTKKNANISPQDMLHLSVKLLQKWSGQGSFLQLFDDTQALPA